jgi:hypothetical protein
VLLDLGFVRRHPLQHIWTNQRLEISVRVPASELPRHSATEQIEAPSGDDVVIWSATDLMLDRIAQAVYCNATERLSQALALRASAGNDFDLARVQQRAADDGAQTGQVVEVFLRLFDALSNAGDDDESSYEPHLSGSGQRSTHCDRGDSLRHMTAKRSYCEIAARRPGGALGAAIARGEKSARTLPSDPASREVLKELGERPERIGPPRTSR